jgi:hypothetical protein
VLAVDARLAAAQLSPGSKRSELLDRVVAHCSPPRDPGRASPATYR